MSGERDRAGGRPEGAAGDRPVSSTSPARALPSRAPIAPSMDPMADPADGPANDPANDPGAAVPRDGADAARCGCGAHDAPDPALDTATPPDRSGPLGLLTRALIALLSAPIIVYRYAVSPMLGRNCRYEPSCSAYGLEALKVHGPVKGLWLTLRRISRCHPWGGMGYDPVPPRRGRKG